jgi:hypothetical protein
MEAHSMAWKNWLRQKLKMKVGSEEQELKAKGQ